MALRILETRPHTIVLASPHNLRLLGSISVVMTENSSGELKGHSGSSVSLRAKCDRQFAHEILHESEVERLPVVGANFGTAEGRASNMQMDWGTLVPLWFLLANRKVKTRIVIVTPSREISLLKNFRFGKLLGRLMQRDVRRRFVFVASADQAHAHSKTGPYGFNKAAPEYDEVVLDAIRNNHLKRLLRLNPAFVERAKPDSLWQMVILAGITETVPSHSELLSYQVPTYYGMACAAFMPTITNRRSV